MKIQKWYDVECDTCGRHLCDFNSDMQQSIKNAKEHAKCQGWKYDKEKDENICPLCLKGEGHKCNFEL